MEICCGFDEVAVKLLEQGGSCLHAWGGVSAVQLAGFIVCKDLLAVLLHLPLTVTNIWESLRESIAFLAFASMSPMGNYDISTNKPSISEGVQY